MRSFILFFCCFLFLARSHGGELLLANFEGEAWSKPFGHGKLTHQAKEGSWALQCFNNNKPWMVEKQMEPEQKDWSNYSYLNFWLFNNMETDKKLVITIFTDSNKKGDKDGAYYFLAKVSLNFTDWKEISLPLSSFAPVYDPKGWGDVEKIQMSIDCYKPFVTDEATPPLIFDQIRLSTERPD